MFRSFPSLQSLSSYPFFDLSLEIQSSSTSPSIGLISFIQRPGPDPFRVDEASTRREERCLWIEKEDDETAPSPR